MGARFGRNKRGVSPSVRSASPANQRGASPSVRWFKAAKGRAPICAIAMAEDTEELLGLLLPQSVSCLGAADRRTQKTAE